MSSAAASSIRPGFPTVSPYLIFRDPTAAFAFYQRVFGAEEISRHLDEQKVVRHGEFRIGDSTFMMTTETPHFPGMKSVETIGATPVHLFVYLANPDEVFAKALAAGASTVMPVVDQFYGRSGGFQDPFGLTWWISTHKSA